ncbi:EFR1 family ferrodoxin [Parabacteroides bouchesdurhonensis]|uniref:EFR1 family ferrodoxin n=1 Tax=Parabacteroides bouchesdurhonensis TaxID=1936995 RepID=UPI000E4FA51B|nr:EFR1 family ferrodoxin [Parabacteroides bouchesdurhonensis]RHJ92511.1 4Fe-4S dicluster domain-containing protein [Bacteroides sp. AM07-16]
MIFYFTGTGNSLWVAKALRDIFGGALISMKEEWDKGSMNHQYSLEKGEKVFLVFPIHAWGLPVSVHWFIHFLTLDNYDGNPIYAVCTCGDDCGLADKVLRKYLNIRGLSLTKAYSVQMPNNYILLPGFDVDSEEVQQRKLENAPKRISAIVDDINGNRKASLYHRGWAAFLKTRVLNRLFFKFMRRNDFYATDACISCGQCEKMCPHDAISVKKGEKPVWEYVCIQCLACIHRCPVRAIEYGKVTLNKGRYHHPDYK